jgi:hypothetical protein
MQAMRCPCVESFSCGLTVSGASFDAIEPERGNSACSRCSTQHHLTGRRRVIIENVTPEIEGGTFAAKRVAASAVVVEADIFADGHEVISGMLLFRREEGKQLA